MTVLIDDEYYDPSCKHLNGATHTEYKTVFKSNCGCDIRTLRKQGRLPMLPYQATHLTVDRPTGTIFIGGDDFCANAGYARFGVAPVKTEDIDYVDGRAIRNLYNRLPDEHPDIGVIVAESRETVETVADRAISIGKAFNYLRRGDVRNAARSLGSPRSRAGISRPKHIRPKEALDWAANVWLEWTYGWQPLLSDVQSVVNELDDKFVINGHNFVTIHTTAKRAFQPNVTGSNYNTLTTKGKQTVRVSYTARVKYDEGSYRQPVAYGITDPGHIAWEKLPYSFVVDWFVPVGDWLRALTFKYSKSITWGDICRSEKIEDRVTVSSTKTRWKVNNQWYPCSITMTRNLDYFKRSVTVDKPPNPNLILDSKRLSDASNIYHWTSAFALLHNAFHNRTGYNPNKL
jgi:ribosomal protein L28